MNKEERFHWQGDELIFTPKDNWNCFSKKYLWYIEVTFAEAQIVLLELELELSDVWSMEVDIVKGGGRRAGRILHIKVKK
jgi:hypothetical protein